MAIFNPAPALTMHIDMNSCFASVEQQANPLLRGKPMVVAAYTGPGGCIIAPSIEAKRLGIKVGMRVKDGKAIEPNLVVLSPDPWKYRFVHLGIKRIISSYSDNFSPKSIDEFVVNMEKFVYLKSNALTTPDKIMRDAALEIKKRITLEVGDWLRVSIGISTNRFLAKVAAGINKPDGLVQIDKNNFLDVYKNLKLTDLCGIKTANKLRLNTSGIFSVKDFFEATLPQLRAAFRSIESYYWFLRIKGFEIDQIDFSRKSFGNSFALPKPLSTPSELSPIIAKLVEKSAFRLRRNGFAAKGVHVGVLFRDFSFWHKGVGFPEALFATSDIYQKAFSIFAASPVKKSVREISVSLFNLVKNHTLQLTLFSDENKKQKLTQSLDKINSRWGNFVITPARFLLGNPDWVPDRIAFGGVKEIENMVLNQF